MFLWGQPTPKWHKILVSVKSGRHYGHLAQAVQTWNKTQDVGM
jgi:hypothetical protein